MWNYYSATTIRFKNIENLHLQFQWNDIAWKNLIFIATVEWNFIGLKLLYISPLLKQIIKSHPLHTSHCYAALGIFLVVVVVAAEIALCHKFKLPKWVSLSVFITNDWVGSFTFRELILATIYWKNNTELARSIFKYYAKYKCERKSNSEVR